MLRIAAFVVMAATLAAADNIGPDSSADSRLNGKYWAREVIYKLDANSGAPVSAQSLSGAVTFDGSGHYNFSGQVFPDAKTGSAKALTQTGTYRVGSNGIASLDSILIPASATEQIYGAVGGNGIFSGSATEGDFTTLLIAIPAGTDASLQGTYWIAHVDYPKAMLGKSKNSLFQVTADGQASFGNVTVKGRDAAQGDAALSQMVEGASYGFGSDGVGSLTFPAPDGVDAGNALFTGTKTLYVSADGNYVLGGDPNGTDIFVGFHPLTEKPANEGLKGIYFFGAVDGDSDLTALFFQSQYGSINAAAKGTTFWHQRTSPFDDLTFDFTYRGSNASLDATDGTLNSPYYKGVVAAGGDAIIYIGNGTDYSLLFGVAAPKVTTTPVSLSPFGVVNGASFSPPTNPIAPGELITLFGSNLANEIEIASTLPYPTSLAGVQVSINGRLAPLTAVSPTQVNAIVPYATSGSYAQVRVINNSQNSNTVTMYLAGCAPGIFALLAGGTGYGAVLHPDFSLVSPDNPARQGEPVSVFLTGLGAVDPPVKEGEAASADPLSRAIHPFGFHFGDKGAATLFQGLVPGLAALYQINVKIPDDAPTGDVDLHLSGGPPGGFCETSQVKIPIAAP